MAFRTATCLILLAFGCTTDEDLSVGVTEQGILYEPGDDGTGSGCPSWGCGQNSPVIAFFEFWDLHELGLNNAQGFRITSFRKFNGFWWSSYRPDVSNAQLLARSSTGDVVYSGASLVGAVFTLVHARSGATYELKVAEVSRMPMWIPTHPYTYTYRLQWRGPNQTWWTDLCGQSVEVDSMPEFHAVLFDDDRIDADAISVTGEMADWFNIGCKSHALAKQHLLGHTKAANAMAGISTTINQRTANLKMLSADYCGNGHPFTVPGQPLHYHDTHTNYYTPGYSGTVEARWTAAGATCLSEPRVDATWSQAGADTFPVWPHGVEDRLAPSQGWCPSRPPACTGTIFEMQGADIISANP